MLYTRRAGLAHQALSFQNYRSSTSFSFWYPDLLTGTWGPAFNKATWLSFSKGSIRVIWVIFTI
jgi:hypothetical protein